MLSEHVNYIVGYSRVGGSEFLIFLSNSRLRLNLELPHLFYTRFRFWPLAVLSESVG